MSKLNRVFIVAVLAAIVSATGCVKIETAYEEPSVEPVSIVERGEDGMVVFNDGTIAYEL